MRPMLLRLGTSVAETRFKRAPQGWIFRAPTPWILGSRAYYRVSDAQKAKIELVLGASHSVVWLLCGALGLVMFLGAPLVLLHVTGEWILFLGILLVMGLQNLWHCFALRAVLDNASRTTEQITFSERLETPAAMNSFGRLIFLLVLFLILSFLLGYHSVTANTLSYVWVAVFGGVVIYLAALFRVKFRSSGRT